MEDLFIVFEFDSGGAASIVQVHCIRAYSAGQAKMKIAIKYRREERLLECKKVSQLSDGWKLIH